LDQVGTQEQVVARSHLPGDAAEKPRSLVGLEVANRTAQEDIQSGTEAGQRLQVALVIAYDGVQAEPRVLVDQRLPTLLERALAHVERHIRAVTTSLLDGFEQDTDFMLRSASELDDARGVRLVHDTLGMELE